MTIKRRHILAIFPGGGPPDTPMRGCTGGFTLLYPSLAASWLGSAVSCRWQGAPPTLVRSPPTLKVVDNPGNSTSINHLPGSGALSNACGGVAGGDSESESELSSSY